MIEEFYDVLGPVKRDGAWFQVRIEKRKTLVSMDGAWLAIVGLISTGLLIMQYLISIVLGTVMIGLVSIFFVHFLVHKESDQLLTVSPAEGTLTVEEICKDETTKIVEHIELQSLSEIKITVNRGRSRYDAHYCLRLIRSGNEIAIFSSPDRKSASLLEVLIIRAKNQT